MKTSDPLAITIPSPCNTSWHNMSPIQGGRFCSSCEKNVYDFTALTDQQLIAYFGQHHDNVCGRFLPGQVEKALYPKSPAARNGNRFYGAALGAALFFGFLTQAQSRAVKPVTQIQQGSKIADEVPEGVRTSLPDTARYLTGKIVDKQSNGSIIYAKVVVKGTAISATSDIEGNFTLRLPARFRDKTITLQCTYLGYKDIEQPVTLRKKKVALNMTMEAYPALLGEVVVIKSEPKHHSWWRRLKHVLGN